MTCSVSAKTVVSSFPVKCVFTESRGGYRVMMRVISPSVWRLLWYRQMRQPSNCFTVLDLVLQLSALKLMLNNSLCTHLCTHPSTPLVTFKLFFLLLRITRLDQNSSPNTTFILSLTHQPLLTYQGVKVRNHLQ